MIETVEALGKMGVGLQSVTESLDTTTAGGRLIFNVFASLAQFERELIRERTKAGLAAARARGKEGGRRKVLTPEKLKIAQALRDDPKQRVGDICKTLGISKATFYRHTRQNVLESLR